MAQTLESKQSSFIDKMAEDTRAVSQALDGRINRQQRNIWVNAASGILAAVAAHIERAETDQAPARFTVRPDRAVPERHPLRDIPPQESADERMK